MDPIVEETPVVDPNTPAPKVEGTPPPAVANAGDAFAKERAGMLADLKTERAARQAAETRHKEQETVLARERKRSQILADLDPKTDEERSTDEVKAAFAKLFPHLANLTQEQIERIQAVAEQGDELKTTTQKYWENHGRQMLGRVHASISDELGGGDLTPRQRQSITNAYIAEAQANPEFLSRHEAGDDTLVAEFVKNFIEDWGGPIRRNVTATEVNRARPLPNGRGRNVQGAAPKKIDFNNPKAVEDAMVESFKNHGGTFPG